MIANEKWIELIMQDIRDRCSCHDIIERRDQDHGLRFRRVADSKTDWCKLWFNKYAV